MTATTCARATEMEEGGAGAVSSSEERQRLLEQQHMMQQLHAQQQPPQSQAPPPSHAQPVSTNVYMSGGDGRGGEGGRGGGGASDLLERKQALERQLRELEAQMAGGGESSHTD